MFGYKLIHEWSALTGIIFSDQTQKTEGNCDENMYFTR